MFSKQGDIPNMWPDFSSLHERVKKHLSTMDMHYGAEVTIQHNENLRMIFRGQSGTLVGMSIPDGVTTEEEFERYAKLLVYLPDVKVTESKVYAFGMPVYRHGHARIKTAPWGMRVFSDIIGTINTVDLVDI